VFDRGIEAVHIITSPEIGGKSFTFKQSTYRCIVSRVVRTEQVWTVAEGRLLMADFWEERFHCRLHLSTGDQILCTFDEDMVDTVLKHLRQFVRVRGEARVDRASNEIQSMVIKDIEPIEEPAEASSPQVSSQAFWNPKDLDEPAAEQGVYPVEGWDKLTGDWPEDADFEEFLEAGRSARQRLTMSEGEGDSHASHQK
jgi:hypothetical protein